MESLFPVLLVYVLLVGVHFVLKFEQKITGGKPQMKLFHALFRITDIVVVALCFILPMILFLNGVENIFANHIQGGIILMVVSVLLLVGSYLILVKPTHRTIHQ